MSTPVLSTLQARVRRRRMLGALGWMLPPAAAIGFGMFWHGLPLPAFVFAMLGLLAIACGLLREIRGVDRKAIVRALDSALPNLDDSTDLLLHKEAQLTALQRLQRARVSARLGSTPLPDLRPAWPWMRIALAWGAALVLVLVPVYWPLPQALVAGPETGNAADAVITTNAGTVLQSAHLRIESPGYTGLSPRDETTLDAAFPAGSSLQWNVRFDSEAAAVHLEFHDGERLPLIFDGTQWQGQRTLVESSLYRIVLEGAPPLSENRLYRLDAIVDTPPEVHVIEPDRSLSIVEDMQRSWNLSFEANDDYGIADARLAITLAQGSGEQITVKEQAIMLRAEAGGDTRYRRYRHRLDLQAVGFAQGDDVIVRLVVSDTRQPQANITRSASFILRWPADVSAEAEGIDGVVQKVLPAYFRSQRQIIIDSEALLAGKSTLDAAKFAARSDAIGVDQKILRLRYGQFLGEEFETGGSGKPNPASDTHSAAHDDAGNDHDHDAAEKTEPEGHGHDDGHEHAASTFGNAGDIVAEYGHTHDHAEAATLLDPETKKILKAALAEMWQAELHLRLADPAQALPYENRALGYIKQVQQSTRIYLARVGLELPPVDESRRLSGDRAGVRDRRGSLSAAQREEDGISAIWSALESHESADLDALSLWLGAHRDRVDDPLAIVAAIDALRREPACSTCMQHLQDLLWPLLPRPVPGIEPRVAPDASGRAYLDALHGGGTP